MMHELADMIASSFRYFKKSRQSGRFVDKLIAYGSLQRFSAIYLKPQAGASGQTRRSLYSKETHNETM
jgi:hypothetical protein